MQRFGRRLLTAAVVVLVCLTSVAWLAPLHAVFELVSNMRVQLLLLATTSIALALASRRWKITALAAVVALVHVAYLLPYWTPTADAVTSAPTATVLQYNIWFGNDDYEAIASTIDDSGAAVVAIHELTETQWAALEPLLDAYPFRVAVPVSDDIGELGGGMALLSQNPVVEIPVASPTNRRDRPILYIETQVAGTPVRVIGLHPHASRFDGAKVELREGQLDATVELALAAPGPVLVMTDMNITPFSPAYKSFLSELGWRDPHEIVGWKATWPAFFGALGTPIDHIFVSNDVLLHDYDTIDGAGSDHAALIATISFKPSDGAES